MTISDWLDEISVKFDELGFVPTTLTDEKCEHFIEWFATEISEIKKEEERLKSENTELKARLKNVVELKARIGDILYMPWVYDGVYDVAKLKICAIFIEGNTITYLTDLTDDLGKRGFCRRYKYGNFEAKDFGTLVFGDRAEAEARLAKLRGEK